MTDTAALVGCAPRDARIVLGQMRAGSLPAGWAIETYRTEDTTFLIDRRN